MKCEICHKAEAETVIYRTADGKKCELYVCAKCAEAEKKRAGAKPPAALPDSLRKTIEELGGDGPGISPASAQAAWKAMKDAQSMLDALLGIFEVDGEDGAHSPEAEPSCPVCGITRHEWRKNERLGCPACYKAFAAELQPIVMEMHRSLRHRGKAPERARAAVERSRLMDQLRESIGSAVRAEDYERAASLRSELLALEKAAKPADGGGDVRAPQA